MEEIMILMIRILITIEAVEEVEDVVEDSEEVKEETVEEVLQEEVAKVTEEDSHSQDKRKINLVLSFNNMETAKKERVVNISM